MRKNEWFKSTRSANNGQCVEIFYSDLSGQVLVRHSKDLEGAFITFSTPEWQAFTAGVRNGEFDVEN